jgi:hypothetical protein
MGIKWMYDDGKPRSKERFCKCFLVDEKGKKA